MGLKELEAAVEAILFAMGGAVELSLIAKALEQDNKTTEKIIHNDAALSGGRSGHSDY